MLRRKSRSASVSSDPNWASLSPFSLRPIIITTNANTIIAKLHDRMPVILPKDCYGLWLDSIREGFSFPEYMRPYDPYKMTVYPVGTMVNNVKNEGEGCIRKVD